MILDIHTHNLSPNPKAIIDISKMVRYDAEFTIPEEYDDSQMFSVGVHPWWLTEELSLATLERIERAAELSQVVIIGEVGIDVPKGGPLFRQLSVFKKMVEISERVAKPLLIHDVKAHEIIVGLHKELQPSQTWIIHGFRSKPTVADMFLRQGMYLSFGERFNPVTVHNIPADRMLAETDESSLPIGEIIHSLSDTRGIDVTHFIEENALKILNGPLS